MFQMQLMNSSEALGCEMNSLTQRMEHPIKSNIQVNFESGKTHAHAILHKTADCIINT